VFDDFYSSLNDNVEIVRVVPFPEYEFVRPETTLDGKLGQLGEFIIVQAGEY